jgi:AcrR family transcriptional regulator
MPSVKFSQTTKNGESPNPVSLPPARTTAKSAETRARIIEGAIRSLETHGISEVTTRRIATAANVQLATLHYHFDSKEALLLAVLDRLNAAMIESLRQIGRDLAIEARLDAMIRASWRHVNSTRHKQIAQIELTLFALRSAGTQWLAARQYEAYVAVYADLIVDEIDLPRPEAETAALALGRFILCGLDGLILQSFSLRDEAAARAGIDTLVVAARDYLRRLTAPPIV